MNASRASSPPVGWQALLLAVLLVANGAAQAVETRFRGPTMGTTWSVVLPMSMPLAHADAWQRRFEAELQRQSDLFSTWSQDSVLSRFNASTSTDYQVLPLELLELLDRAHAISRASDGAYDVTLGEVFALYGVGANAAVPDVAPDPASVTAALARARPVALVRDGERLRKRDARVQLDLSSIAKGHAVDRLGRLLEAGGAQRYLVEIGGEVRTRGVGVGGTDWRVGIESPDGSVSAGLALRDAHLASSGSYRDWREIDGERVSHVIDGRDGQPIRHDLVSVTVLADSTAGADAWATALLVLGHERAQALAQRHALDVQLVRRAGSGFSVWRTPGFQARVQAFENLER